MLIKGLEWVSVSKVPLHLGNIEARSFPRAFELERYMPYKRVSLSTGAPFGNLEVIRCPGLYERKG